MTSFCRPTWQNSIQFSQFLMEVWHWRKYALKGTKTDDSHVRAHTHAHTHSHLFSKIISTNKASLPYLNFIHKLNCTIFKFEAWKSATDLVKDHCSINVRILGLQTVMLYCHFMKFIHGIFIISIKNYIFYISSQLTVSSAPVKINDTFSSLIYYGLNYPP